MLTGTASPFDDFAWFYDRHWAAPFEQWQRPALERLLFPKIPSGSTILDLCCGTGSLGRYLTALGYRLFGIDSSEGMLEIARQNLPEARFMLADASDFAIEHCVDAATCFFDSLNNLLDSNCLQNAFHCVYSALAPSGVFVFDVNTGAAYGERWNRSACEVLPDHAFFLRGGFDATSRIGHTQITTFRRQGEGWRRADSELRQRPWEIAEVERMLRSAGFNDVQPHRAQEDLNMSGHYGIGRVYFCALKRG